MILFPSNYKEFPNASDGEREIYSRLRNTKLGSDWIVLHSLEILQHIKRDQSEADYVFMIPNVGVLILEVKACKTLSFDGTVWKLGNKTEARGPFKQANENMHSIRAYLSSMNIDLRSIPFVSAVWFTHLPKNQIETSISWNPEDFLSSEDLKLEITEVIQKKTENLITGLKLNFGNNRASSVELEKISQCLRPRFVAHQAPKERARDVKQFLEQALNQQMDYVKLFGQIRALAIQGLAGTGKTYIAIQVAREAHERGERVLFICYNHLLAEQLKKQMANYPLVKVSSLHALLLEVSDVDVPPNADDEWWKVVLPTEALKNAEIYSQKNKFDTLVIDEAQDLGTTDLLVVLDQILDGGLSESHKILICGDFDHQGVYLPGINTLANYKNAIPDLVTPSPLLTNCRNTKTLGDFLNTFLAMDPNYEKFLRSDADGVVEAARVSSEEEILIKVRNATTELLQKFTPEQVVILSAQKSKLAQLVTKLDFKTTEIRKPKTNHVRWGSPQEFKGLEALAILLIEFFDKNPVLDETFYIGATRSIHDFYFVIPRDKIDELAKEGD